MCYAEEVGCERDTIPLYAFLPPKIYANKNSEMMIKTVTVG